MINCKLYSGGEEYYISVYKGTYAVKRVLPDDNIPDDIEYIGSFGDCQDYLHKILEKMLTMI